MVSKKDLLKHYDRRISELKELLAKTSFTNRRTEAFNLLLGRSRTLVSKTLGAATADAFLNYVSPKDVEEQSDMDSDEHFIYRRQSIQRAIAMLKKYRLEVEKMQF